MNESKSPTSETSDRSPLLSFLPPQSSRPGTALKMMELGSLASRVPFRGGCFTVEAGANSRPDNHVYTELWMIAKGRGILRYADQIVTISEGDFLLYEPWHTHAVHNDGPEQLVIYTVWWNVETS